MSIPRSRWFLGILPALLVMAVLLRAGLMLPNVAQLTTDRDLYLGIAQEIQAGHGFSTPGTQTSTPTAFRPPLYPLVLSLLPQWAAPPWPALSIAGLHLLLTVFLVVATARASELTARHSHCGLIAAAIVVVDPLLILYTTMPMTETLCAALSAGLLWMAARRSGTLLERRQHSWPEGLLWGLCILARPTYLAAMGLTMAGELLPMLRRSTSNESRRAGIRRGIVLVVGAALVVAPWAIRNQMVLGRPIFTTTHGGYTLWLANNPVFYEEVVEAGAPAWEGGSLDRWQRANREAMHAAGVHGEVAEDDWQSARAKAFIVQNPLGFVRAMVHRARSFWAVVPRQTQGYPASIAVGLGIYYLILWLALLGAIVWLMRCRAWSMLWPPLALIASFGIVHLVYWTDTRMRAPIMPAVGVLIAAALSQVRSRRENVSSEVVTPVQ